MRSTNQFELGGHSETRNRINLSALNRICYFTCFLFCLGGCSGTPDLGHRGITFDIHPSGDRVVFTAKGNGTRDLYLLDLKTRRVTRLSDTPAFESDPAFSPDGKWIVYSALPKPDNPKSPAYLYLLNLETKATRQLTSGQGTSDSAPVFVLNGSRILFSRAHRVRRYSMGGYVWDRASLYIIRPDGTGERALPLDWYYSASHEGRHLFSLKSDSTERRLVRISLDVLVKQQKVPLDGALLNKKARESSQEWERFWTQALKGIPKNAIGEMPVGLTQAFNAASEFVFSPDGQSIAFIADREREFDYRVWLFETKGRTIRPLTQEEQTRQYNECLRFMPDGRSVLFLRLETNGFSMKNGVWQVGTDGKDLKQIADYTLFDNPLSWKPKSKR